MRAAFVAMAAGLLACGNTDETKTDAADPTDPTDPSTPIPTTDTDTVGSIPCTDVAPDHATSVVVDVSATAPENCEWSCDAGWLPVRDFCSPEPICADGWCFEWPYPTYRGLVDAWGPADDDVWVVGYSGTLLHWDGERWTGTFTDSLTDWYDGVWGFASDDVWIGGSEGRLEHYDGTTWAGSPLPAAVDDYIYEDVWGSDPASVWALGRDGFADVSAVLFWDGTSWTVQAQMPVELEHLSGRSATDIWAVGDDALYHFDGVDWTFVDVPPVVSTVDGLAALSTGEVAVSGWLSYLLWDGSTWREEDPPVSNVRALMELDGVLWGAVDELGAPPLLGRVGPESFSTQPAGDVSSTHGLGPVGTSGAMALGSYGHAMTLEAGAWSPVAPEARGRLQAAAFIAEDDIWLGGDPTNSSAAGFTLHWDGSHWDRGTTAFEPIDLHAVSATEVYAVSFEESVWLYDGAYWSELLDHDDRLVAVHATAADNLWVVGQVLFGTTGFVLQWDGLTWTEHPLPLRDVLDIVSLSPTDVWVTGGNGSVYHYDGVTWTPIDVSAFTDEDLEVAALAPDDVWLVADWPDSLVLRGDADGFVVEAEFDFIEKITVVGPDRVTLADGYDLRAWSAATGWTQVRAPISSDWAFPRGSDWVAVGEGVVGPEGP